MYVLCFGFMGARAYSAAALAEIPLITNIRFFFYFFLFVLSGLELWFPGFGKSVRSYFITIVLISCGALTNTLVCSRFELFLCL